MSNHSYACCCSGSSGTTHVSGWCPPIWPSGSYKVGEQIRKFNCTLNIRAWGDAEVTQPDGQKTFINSSFPTVSWNTPLYGATITTEVTYDVPTGEQCPLGYSSDPEAGNMYVRWIIDGPDVSDEVAESITISSNLCNPLTDFDETAEITLEFEHTYELFAEMLTDTPNTGDPCNGVCPELWCAFPDRSISYQSYVYCNLRAEYKHGTGNSRWRYNGGDWHVFEERYGVEAGDNTAYLNVSSSTDDGTTDSTGLMCTASFEYYHQDLEYPAVDLYYDNGMSIVARIQQTGGVNSVAFKMWNAGEAFTTSYTIYDGKSAMTWRGTTLRMDGTSYPGDIMLDNSEAKGEFYGVSGNTYNYSGHYKAFIVNATSGVMELSDYPADRQSLYVSNLDELALPNVTPVLDTSDWGPYDKRVLINRVFPQGYDMSYGNSGLPLQFDAFTLKMAPIATPIRFNSTTNWTGTNCTITDMGDYIRLTATALSGYATLDLSGGETWLSPCRYADLHWTGTQPITLELGGKTWTLAAGTTEIDLCRPHNYSGISDPYTGFYGRQQQSFFEQYSPLSNEIWAGREMAAGTGLICDMGAQHNRYVEGSAGWGVDKVNTLKISNLQNGQVVNLTNLQIKIKNSAQFIVSPPGEWNRYHEGTDEYNRYYAGMGGASGDPYYYSVNRHGILDVDGRLGGEWLGMQFTDRDSIALGCCVKTGALGPISGFKNVEYPYDYNNMLTVNGDTEWRDMPLYFLDQNSYNINNRTATIKGNHKIDAVEVDTANIPMIIDYDKRVDGQILGILYDGNNPDSSHTVYWQDINPFDLVSSGYMSNGSVTTDTYGNFTIPARPGGEGDSEQVNSLAIWANSPFRSGTISVRPRSWLRYVLG